MTSPNSELDLLESDYSSFVTGSINFLLEDEKKKNKDLSQADELKIAINFCKNYLAENLNANEDAKREVMNKLVELRLELVYIEDLIAKGEVVQRIKRHKGHEFVVQSAYGKNPYCENCIQTIFRLAQSWRRCKNCGLRSHDKCIDEMVRPCAGLLIKQKNFALNLQISPEVGLLSQSYKCHECSSPIGFNKNNECEARLCDYTGKYYCKKCHWNDEAYIPARLVRNFDSQKRPICRATKQLLTLLEQKPVINLAKENPNLFTYVNSLKKIQQIRTKIMFMKCYFLSCKKARKIRILQYLSRYQHFVETDYLYSLIDLVQIANGTMVQEVESIANIFFQHITKDCQTCQGKAFICEICRIDKVIYPFDEDVSICKICLAVFHSPCFNRVSKRCPRCIRRRTRDKALNEEDEQTADPNAKQQSGQ